MKVESKIDKFLNEHATPVELTVKPIPDRKAISHAWPHGILWQGKAIFEPYIHCVKALQQLVHKDYPGDSQEVFLGYSPSSETFVMGFDYWEDTDSNAYYDNSDDDENYTEDNNEANFGSIYIPLHFDGTTFKPFGKAVQCYKGFYDHGTGAGYEVVHTKYRDLIDLRLD